MGISADGTVMTSQDSEQWQEAGRLDGSAEALIGGEDDAPHQPAS